MRERGEEKARGARQKDNGKEDDANGQCGDDRGKGDLACAAKDGDGDVGGEFAIPIDVLDLDSGVVDQHSDRKSQSAECHDVDGVSGELKPDERGENG